MSAPFQRHCASSTVGPIRRTDVAYRHVARRLTDDLSGIDWPRRPGRGFFLFVRRRCSHMGRGWCLSHPGKRRLSILPRCTAGYDCGQSDAASWRRRNYGSVMGAGCDARPALAQYPILASKLPLSEDGQGALETIVIELSSKQAREKCHQTLVAGLRLIRPEERVTAIAAAMQEVEAREKRLYAALVRQ
jgi:hypothetical protein